MEEFEILVQINNSSNNDEEARQLGDILAPIVLSNIMPQPSASIFWNTKEHSYHLQTIDISVAEPGDIAKGRITFTFQLRTIAE